jgi:uncharacterized membrane-anchored protein YitT (DUF2179 family)
MHAIRGESIDPTKELKPFMNPPRPIPVAVAATPMILPLPQISARFVKVLSNLILLTGGSLLWVLALQCFMVPHHILSGGLLGIAMICGHFFPSVDVAWLNLFFNLPLFWLGWRYVGVAFTLYSLFGTLAFSLLAGLVALPFIVDVPPLWASLGAGLLGGGGSAMILRSAGTAGGLDILIVFLRNRFRWRVGPLVMALNGTILTAAGGLMGLKALAFSLLFLTLCSYTVDALVPGPAAQPPLSAPK